MTSLVKRINKRIERIEYKVVKKEKMKRWKIIAIPPARTANYEFLPKKKPKGDPWARNCNSFILVESFTELQREKKIVKKFNP